MKKEKESTSTIVIKLPFTNRRTAQSICQAISPENQETPPGTKAVTYVEGTNILCQVNSDGNLWDLIVTVEDFFEKIDLSMRTIQKIKNEQK